MATHRTEETPEDRLEAARLRNERAIRRIQDRISKVSVALSGTKAINSRRKACRGEDR